MNRPIGIVKCKIYFNDLVIFFRKIMKINVVVQMLKATFLDSVKTFQTLKKLKITTKRILKAFTKLKSKKKSFFNKQLKNQKRKKMKLTR